MKNLTRHAKLLSCIVFIGVFLAMNGTVQAQERRSRRGKSIDQILAERDVSLKQSLVDLKLSAQEIVNNNSLLSTKINRLQGRIPELNGELKILKESGAGLLNEHQALKRELRGEKETTQLVGQKASDLERSTTLSQEDEVKYKRLMREKRLEIKSLQEVSEHLRDRIERLEEKLKKQQNSSAGNGSQSSKLNRELRQTRQKIRELSQQSLNDKERMLSSESRFNQLKETNAGLNQQILDLKEEVASIVEENNQTKEEGRQIEQDHQTRLKQLDDDIAMLSERQVKLEEVVRESKNSHTMISSSFRSKRGEYEKAVKHLEQEQRFLLEQSDLLEEVLVATQELVDQVKVVTALTGSVGGFNQAVVQLKLEQAQLNDNIDAKKEEQKSLEMSKRDLQKSINLLKGDLRTSQQVTQRVRNAETRKFDRLIQDQQKRVSEKERQKAQIQNQSVGPRKRLAGLSQKKAELSSNLQSIEKGIKESEDTRNKLLKQAADIQGQDKVTLAQLETDIAKLKIYHTEMQNLLDVVNKEFKADSIDLKAFRKEEKQLRDHMDLLEIEHENLQEQILGLMMVNDRLQGNPKK